MDLAQSRIQNNIPMTIPMLKRVVDQGEPFVIDQVHIDQVEVLGLVTSFKESGTLIEITLEESSDEVVVSTYRNNSTLVPAPFLNYTYKEKQYALVIGDINLYRGKLSINAA